MILYFDFTITRTKGSRDVLRVAVQGIFIVPVNLLADKLVVQRLTGLFVDSFYDFRIHMFRVKLLKV